LIPVFFNQLIKISTYNTDYQAIAKTNQLSNKNNVATLFVAS